jgi:hypothetical protein
MGRVYLKTELEVPPALRLGIRLGISIKTLLGHRTASAALTDSSAL